MLPMVLAIALAALFVASWTDIRTREIPDWLSYGLIATGVAFGVLASLVASAVLPLLFSLAGLAFGVAFGYAMYYSGQWGGGDSKLLMGLGALLGLPFFDHAFSFSLVWNSFFISFLVNIFLVGVVYALGWSVALSFVKHRQFTSAFSTYLQQNSITRRVLVVLAAVVLMFSVIARQPLVSTSLYLLGTLTFLTFYLFAFVRAVEKGCMHKFVRPEQLSEGDWIAKDIVVHGRRIAGPKDLGVEKKQIKALIALHKKKKISTVLVKEGIPFVPSFLLGFLATLQWGNLLALLLG